MIIASVNKPRRATLSLCGGTYLNSRKMFTSYFPFCCRMIPSGDDLVQGLVTSLEGVEEGGATLEAEMRDSCRERMKKQDK